MTVFVFAFAVSLAVVRSELRELVAAQSRSAQMGGRGGLLAVRVTGRPPGGSHLLLRVRGLRLHSRVRRGSEKPAEGPSAGHHPVAVRRVPRLLRRVVRPHPDDTVLRAGKYKCVYFGHKTYGT